MNLYLIKSFIKLNLQFLLYYVWYYNEDEDDDNSK